MGDLTYKQQRIQNAAVLVHDRLDVLRYPHSWGSLELHNAVSPIQQQKPVAVLVIRSPFAFEFIRQFQQRVEQWRLDTISPLITTSSDYARLSVIDSTLRFDLA